MANSECFIYLFLNKLLRKCSKFRKFTNAGVLNCCGGDGCCNDEVLKTESRSNKSSDDTHKFITMFNKMPVKISLSIIILVIVVEIKTFYKYDLGLSYQRTCGHQYFKNNGVCFQ